MLYVTPVSAIHHGYPSTYHRTTVVDPSYYPTRRWTQDYDNVAELAVERAARDYAIAKARLAALQRQRAEQARIYEQQRQQQLEDIRRAHWIAQLSSLERQRAPQHVQPPRRRYVRSDLTAPDLASLHEAAYSFHEHLRETPAERLSRRLEQRRQLHQAIAEATKRQEPESIPRSAPEARPLETLLTDRLDNNEEEEIRDVVSNLLAQLLGANVVPAEKPAAAEARDKGKARETPAVPFPWSRPTEQAEQKKSVHFEDSVRRPNPDAHHPPTASSLDADAKEFFVHHRQRLQSLKAVDSIRTSFDKLRASFVFPTALDFSPRSSRSPSPTPESDNESESGSLPFTHRNKPVLAYEHALNGFLTQLDSIDSNGDEEVRKRRREVVIEVEQALGAVAQLVSAGQSEATPVPAAGAEQADAEVVNTVEPQSKPVPATLEERTVVDVVTADEPQERGEVVVEDAAAVLDVADPHDVAEPTSADGVSNDAERAEEIALVSDDTEDRQSAAELATVVADEMTHPEESAVSTDEPQDDSTSDPSVSDAPELLIPAAGEPSFPDTQLTPVSLGDDLNHDTEEVQSSIVQHNELKYEDISPSTPSTETAGTEPFLLQSSPLEEDEDHIKAKARAATSPDEDTDWEQAKHEDEEAWTEV